METAKAANPVQTSAATTQQLFVGADLSTVPEASTAQDGTPRLQDASFTISSDDPGLNSSTAETKITENHSEIARTRLDALKSGVKELNDWYETGKQALLDGLKSPGLAQHLIDGVVRDVFANTPAIIQKLDETRQKIERIFEDTKTFSVTEKTLTSYSQLRSTFDGDLSQLKELVGRVASQFKACPGTDAPGKHIQSIRDGLKTLDESPLIKPQEKEVVKLEDPFEQQFAKVDHADSTMLAIAPPVDWRELQAHSELARRDRKFGTIVESSKEQALPLEARLTGLGNWSIAEHLTAKFSEQIRAVEAATTKQEEDRRTKIGNKKAQLQKAIEDQEKELEPLRAKWLSLGNKCLELKAAVDQNNTPIDDATAASTGSDSTQGQASTPNGFVVQVTSAVWDWLTSSKSNNSDSLDSNQTSQEPQLANIESQQPRPSELKAQLEEEEKELEKTTQELTRLTAAIELQTAQVRELDSALGDLDQNSREILPNTPQAKLEEALRDTCKGLHFKNPQDPSDPIVRALLDVSIPKTKEPIPSFDSISARLLAVGFVEVNGKISCIHQETGVKLTIERRAEHGLDATLTISGADGKARVSDRIWNHNLEAVVRHFLLNGNAEVEPAVQDEWQVPTQDQQTQETADMVEKRDNVRLELESRLGKLKEKSTLNLDLDNDTQFAVTKGHQSNYTLKTVKNTERGPTTITESGIETDKAISSMLGTANALVEQLYNSLGSPAHVQVSRSIEFLTGLLKSRNLRYTVNSAFKVTVNDKQNSPAATMLLDPMNNKWSFSLVGKFTRLDNLSTIEAVWHLVGTSDGGYRNTSESSEQFRNNKILQDKMCWVSREGQPSPNPRDKFAIRLYNDVTGTQLPEDARSLRQLGGMLGICRTLSRSEYVVRAIESPLWEAVKQANAQTAAGTEISVTEVQRTPLQRAAQSLFDSFKGTVIHVRGEGRSQFSPIKGILRKIEVKDNGYFEVTYSALENDEPKTAKGSVQKVGSAFVQEEDLLGAVGSRELVFSIGTANNIEIRFTGKSPEGAKEVANH